MLRLTAALAKATDHDTKAHLEGAKDQIAKILDPKFLPPAPAAAAAADAAERRKLVIAGSMRCQAPAGHRGRLARWSPHDYFGFVPQPVAEQLRSTVDPADTVTDFVAQFRFPAPPVTDTR